LKNHFIVYNKPDLISTSAFNWQAIQAKQDLLCDITELYNSARRAGRKAGDKNMKKHNRATWNKDDFNAAAREFNKLVYKLYRKGISKE